MAKVSTQSYKGARDFYPEDKRQQQWMFSKWKTVVERFGYVEYDAPILELTDLYLMKGSEEIVRDQTYTFQDRGKRSVTIRTEMTPSVSRMVAGRRQELAYPARWYSIPNLWRYERMQRGRLREFWQLNVDMFGVAGLSAELEMLEIIDAIFREFKAKRNSYVIKLNSRVLVNKMFESYCGLDKKQSEKMIRLTDHMNKMTASEFEKAVSAITTDQKSTKRIVELLKARQVNDLPKEVLNSTEAESLNELIKNCKSLGITNVEFDICLMRGFDYYTDIVFEAFDTDPENGRSLLGGGRYDGLVAQFGVEPVPTIGFAVGDVGFSNFLQTHKLVPELSLSVDLVILPEELENLETAQDVARVLRENSLNVSTDFSDKKFDKKLKSAIKSGVRFALIVGQNKDKLRLKDLKTSKEEVHSAQRVAKLVSDRR